MSKTRECMWFASFVREDGTHGSTHVKAKNSVSAIKKVQRNCRLSSSVVVKVMKK